MKLSGDPFAAHRSRLLGLAYRMLGSRADAEDVLQDAFIRFSGAREVENTGAFLVTTVTRLCLDRLKSARARREVYVGPWLPEPVTDATELSPETATELAEDLSFALLLALERLNPAERAAFLLHDVFSLSFAEVALALERSEATCRQLAARARKSVREARPTQQAPPEAHSQLLKRFNEAIAGSDMTALMKLLRHDAIAVSDGGGVRQAALRPIYGAEKVSRFFIKLMQKKLGKGEQVNVVFTTINSLPGQLVYVNGQLDNSLSIELDNGLIVAIYSVRNPDKLRRLHQLH